MWSGSTSTYLASAATKLNSLLIRNSAGRSAPFSCLVNSAVVKKSNFPNKFTRSFYISENLFSSVVASKDVFMDRHIGPSGDNVDEMLKIVGASSIEALMDETIPSSIRLPATFGKDDAVLQYESISESEVLSKLYDLAKQNKVNKSYIGMGYHDCILPSVIRRNLLEDATWYTAYTPYQAEISQGRLESLLNFQTVVTELTGMVVSNASLLDEASAAAEAMSMLYKSSEAGKKDTFYVSSKLHPQTIDVIQTRAVNLGLNVVIGDHNDVKFEEMKNLFGAIVQYPDTEGKLQDFGGVANALHSHGAQLVVASDPLSLVVNKPPSEFGADVVVGSMQRFGVPMGFGGPHAGYLATSNQNMRRMPGRIIGVSIDAKGSPAYRMSLQTREQHIRKDKATSNICTAQALLANIAAMYAVYHGPEGLAKIAHRVRGLTSALKAGVETLGYTTLHGDNFFDTLAIATPPLHSSLLAEIMESRGMNIRSISDRIVGVSLDETTSLDDVNCLLQAFADARGVSFTPLTVEEADAKISDIPQSFKRIKPFLQQQIFNTIRNETEMMRYIKHLEKKDLGLNTSMISLGSCTMKLNPAATLQPILWPEFCQMHPFAPVNQTRGYRAMIFDLCNKLSLITGFDATSLQPNSGATGEYSGLLAIKSYHQSIGQGHRNVCIIPKSAHGTNPASAAMAGLKIKAVDSDAKGNIYVEQLEEIAKANADNLAALMITYPSTHGVFEESIKSICDIVHKYGGLVYMDGANMNAQLGMTSPGFIGADVCHLNLHKTFAIPHGGGGPGVGAICVRKLLVPFLPSHSVVKTALESVGAPVAAAPFGSAMILPITYTFINMLGIEGLKKSAQFAILNANYMMNRLKGYYNMKYSGKTGRCAHEFILDVEAFKKSCNVVEEDIAKRLMDYGFHAPTMSWPVSSALMVEPTESESKGELDRFCDALISIRGEIAKIENGEWPKDNNPLKNSPHTENDLASEEWNKPYSRQVAAFPLPWVAQRGKFWPSISRINNTYGERNLVCTCGSVSDYAS